LDNPKDLPKHEAFPLKLESVLSTGSVPTSAGVRILSNPSASGGGATKEENIPLIELWIPEKVEDGESVVFGESS
jgi:hypothetical protein